MGSVPENPKKIKIDHVVNNVLSYSVKTVSFAT